MNDGPERSRRVKSLSAGEHDLDHLQRKYDEIYGSSDVWLYKKSHGVHAVILSLLDADLAGRHVLDVGCGAGRLSIMCALRGATVTGVDFSEAAIEIAELNAAAAGAEIRLEAAEIGSFCTSTEKTYDLITMVGVLEHVPDPVETLASLAGIAAPEALLVTSCPNFINLRGFSYMTLLTLLALPLSLADVRQVDYVAMQKWAELTGWSYERAVGALYRFGWDENAAADMRQRLPLAVRDSGLDVEFDYAAYGDWVTRMSGTGGDLLAWLHERGVLERVRGAVTPQLRRVGGIDDRLWSLMEQYMAEDVTADPYYCKTPPFAMMGGECIYLLTKRS